MRHTLLRTLHLFLLVGLYGLTPMSAMSQTQHIAARIWPRAVIGVSEPEERLVENTTVTIPFDVRLEPGVGGAKPAIDIVVCGESDDVIGECTVLTKDNYRRIRGSVPLRIPTGGPDIELTLVVCELQIDPATQIRTCGHRLTSHSFRRPIYARFKIGLESFTIFHTRARTEDTVHIGLLALSDVKQASVSTLYQKQCLKTPLAPSVAKPVLCRPINRFGEEDTEFRNGTYPVPEDYAVGEYELVPGAGGGLNFSFVIFNYGFPGNGTTDGWFGVNVHNRMYGSLFATNAQGRPKLNESPSEDFTQELNAGPPWLGCDGPTAAGSLRLPNDTSGRSLGALTRESGRHAASSKVYIVESQVGCGADSRYQVRWFVSRTTWR